MEALREMRVIGGDMNARDGREQSSAMGVIVRMSRVLVCFRVLR
jgi:hypothetical protein